ncbi:hypothetical protein SAY86_016235 [Trapa natans]|uniref:B30.2/SPRY domain-containing protein n=1 Tax=Trapa natans TaxID=22666 RepID=A0AAN7R188_TRANT|nr:hypothetical protein SAY86_016235 [Trapa natans]
MPPWMGLVVVVICVFILAGILGLFVWRFFNSKSRSKLDHIDLTGRVIVGHQQTLQDGITKLHQESRKQPPLILSTRRRTASPIFSWGEHPSLVTDAVENGWSCFAFVVHTELPPSPPSRSTFLGLCGAADIGQDPEPDISWEVCQGSADLVQKIRLNHHHRQPPLSSLSVIKTSLPLPGPPLGNSSFPQEAFFEITILSFGNRHGSEIKEGEKTKLTQDMSNLRSKSESLVYTRRAEELTLNVRDDGKSQAEVAAAAFGLTFGGSPPLKLPGSYLGSIGFNSTGSVYLDGVKLVFESQKAEWAMWGNNVIGCGFDPKQKMVFFTMGSDLLHVIYCKSEVFGAPMYPIIAANSDMVVLVNFGQFPFEYAPANDNRTSNPCFTGPAVRPSVSALGYEDSKELFSMGRINAQWLNGSMYRGSHNNNNSSVDIDVESEADLFEIVLDSSSGISQFPGNVMTGNNNNKNIKINSSSR